MFISDDAVPQLGAGFLDSLTSVVTDVASGYTAQKTAAKQTELVKQQTKQVQAQTQLTLAQRAAAAIRTPAGIGISAGVLVGGAALLYFLLKRK
jgi:hypothetical protein